VNLKKIPKKDKVDMQDQYNPNSCNLAEKECYTPTEAAIRWCGLSQYEDRILNTIGNGIPRPDTFPQWPCLRINLLKISNAISNHEIQYALNGIVVDSDPYPRIIEAHLAQGTLTIPRRELKQWMTKNYPDQKPPFLFDEIERNTHTAISADSLRALQADRDALRARLKTLETQYGATSSENNALNKKIEDLTSKLESFEVPHERSEKTYQNIIVALLHYIQGEVPGIKGHPEYKSEAKLIEAICEKYTGYGGLTKRTLEERLSAAKKNFQNQ
jgi:hypothetical protein